MASSTTVDDPVSRPTRNTSNGVLFLKRETAQICVHGFIRNKEKSLSLKQFIPDSIKDLIFEFSYDGFQTLSFSQSYQSGKWKFKNNDTIAVNMRQSKHQYILCDTEPVSKGIHCWRVYVKASSAACVMWSISEIYKYEDRSFESKKQVWGGISSGYIVKSGSFTYDQRVHYNSIQSPYQVDMLLNCEAGNFKMGVVDNDKFVTIEFNALPKNFKYGFVPHFNLYLKDSFVRCVKIPPQLFRQRVDLPLFEDN